MCAAVAKTKSAGQNFISLKLMNSTITAANYTEFNSKEAAANKPVLIVRPFTPVTLSPVADAYVQGGSRANTNYGTATMLVIKKTVQSNYRREAYLRFDISSLPSVVPSAKLRIYGSLLNNSNVSAGIELHGVANQTWGETTITWNNKPVADAAIIATKTITGATDQYYEIDVSSYLAAAKSAGATFVTFQIAGATELGNNYTDFNSREAAANKPQLVIGGSAAARLAFEETEEVISEEISSEKQEMTFYPNPAVDFVTISFPGFAGKLNVTVFDMSGKLVINKQLTGDALFNLPLSELRSGLYLLRTEWEGGSKTERMVIQ